MSSKRTRPRSIASQLVLLFTLAATLLLACGLGVFYSIVVRNAFAEDNAVLADKMFAVSAALRENGPSALAAELMAPRHAGEHTTYWIRILDSQGRTYAQTPGMDRLFPPEIFPPPQKSAGTIGGLKDYRTESKLFTLVALNEEFGSQPYTLQVAQDRSSDEQVERRFAFYSASCFLAAFLPRPSIAITVTRRGLRRSDR